ncbi:XdhC family protein [Nocardia heshunensis]
MLNIAATLADWHRHGLPFALATVVGVRGSAPLPPGTSMAVGSDGRVAGSISGGCVEATVYELCRHVLDIDGTPKRTRFGYSDTDAFAVGLTCGGEIDVLVDRIDPAATPQLAAALDDVAHDRSVAIAQIVDGPAELLGRMIHVPAHTAPSGSLGDAEVDSAAIEAAGIRLEAGAGGYLDIDACALATRLTLFIHVRTPRPRMVIFGAVDFAAALSEIGDFLGYRVTVCDARATFATPERFPHAEIVVDWPHRYLAATGIDIDTRTVLCVLTHDPKFDIPLLQLALGLGVDYVGAMGSRRTHQQRLDQLREIGVPAERLAHLHSPIGLDLGARTPAETAIGIAAEIIANTNQRTGQNLSRATGPIHDAAQDMHQTTRVARPFADRTV